MVTLLQMQDHAIILLKIFLIVNILCISTIVHYRYTFLCLSRVQTQKVSHPCIAVWWLSVCHMTFTIEYIHLVLQLRQQLLVSTKYTQMVQTKILRFGLSSVLILPLAVSTKPNEIIYNVLFARRWMINDLGRYTWMTMELISRACKIHSFKHGLNWGQILGYRLILRGPKC